MSHPIDQTDKIFPRFKRGRDSNNEKAGCARRRLDAYRGGSKDTHTSPIFLFILYHIITHCRSQAGVTSVSQLSSVAPTMDVTSVRAVLGPWDYVVLVIMLAVSSSIGVYYRFTGKHIDL